MNDINSLSDINRSQVIHESAIRALSCILKENEGIVVCPVLDEEEIKVVLWKSCDQILFRIIETDTKEGQLIFVYDNRVEALTQAAINGDKFTDLDPDIPDEVSYQG